MRKGLAQGDRSGGSVSEAQLPRILRKHDEPDYLIFVELFFDLAYIFILMPGAFHESALGFVLAYFAIHLARDVVLIPGTRVNRDIQARSIRVFFWLGISAVPWLAPHLAERHRQIVIVAFGELILTSSAGLASKNFTAPHITAFALSLGSAILLFQLYLVQIRSLQQPEAAARVAVIQPGTFASYWHLIMVAGVVCISAGARAIASHPYAQVPLTRTLIILAGPALFLFGTCLFDWSVTGRFMAQDGYGSVGGQIKVAVRVAVVPGRFESGKGVPERGVDAFGFVDGEHVVQVPDLFFLVALVGSGDDGRVGFLVDDHPAHAAAVGRAAVGIDGDQVEQIPVDGLPGC